MLINTVDTAASISEKLLENMPSHTRFDRCQNNICLEEEISLGGLQIFFRWLQIITNNIT